MGKKHLGTRYKGGSSGLAPAKLDLFREKLVHEEKGKHGNRYSSSVGTRQPVLPLLAHPVLPYHSICCNLPQGASLLVIYKHATNLSWLDITDYYSLVKKEAILGFQVSPSLQNIIIQGVRGSHSCSLSGCMYWYAQAITGNHCKQQPC